jgi:hypothetical protein
VPAHARVWPRVLDHNVDPLREDVKRPLALPVLTCQETNLKTKVAPHAPHPS